MKKLCVLSICTGMLTVSSLLANQVGTVDTYGPYQTGVGGEFTLQILDNALGDPNYPTVGAPVVTKTTVLSAYGYNAGSGVALNQWNVSGTTPNFQTFCVEGSEFIYPSPAIYDTSLGQISIFGNTHLSVGAALLYYDFAKGLFNGAGGRPTYNYANPTGRHTSAGQLQNAIWWLMGQESQTYDSSNPYDQFVVSTFGDPTKTGSTANKLGGFAWNSSLANPISVDVLSLWVPGQTGTDAGKRQDQLLLTGNQGFNKVADGGMTLALLGMALTGLSAVGRRIRR